MRRYFFLVLIISTPLWVVAQQTPVDTLQREATIIYQDNDNRFNFSATTPPLQQMMGAPKAFYNFYWEFGDGHFSRDAQPQHTYEKEGEYTVRLWTTNNYDNGKPPPSRPQKVKVNNVSYDYQPIPFPGAENILEIKNNRDPSPEEEMVVVLSYANDQDDYIDGKLYVFFNEKKFKDENFTLQEVRTYHGERIVPDEVPVVAAVNSPSPVYWASLESIPLPTKNLYLDKTLQQELDEDREYYESSHVLEFDGMAPGEVRNVFYSFLTTPEMLKDTSAVVKVKGVLVPNRKGSAYRTKELEMEIVTSHDPNKMSVYDARLNYRTYKNKTLDFKIKFQNNGEGPASSIRLEVDIPSMYDKYSLQVSDMYPACPICPDGQAVSYSCLDTLFMADKIIFHFKNIYLPGSNQQHVEERDSTKGFVKYSLKFQPKIDKKKTISRTAIIFDKNEPVITNYATTRFKPGLSIGAKAGYNYFKDLSSSQSFFIGGTISPYKSYHGYWQAELMAEWNHYSDADSSYNTTMTPVNGLQGYFDLYEVSRLNQYKNLNLTLVPASYHYNVNHFFSVGAGMQLSGSVYAKTQQQGIRKYYLFIEPEDQRQRDAKRDVIINNEETTSGAFDFDVALFGDLTLGSSRIGPTLGVRYIYHFNEPHIQYQFYALWKF